MLNNTGFTVVLRENPNILTWSPIVKLKGNLSRLAAEFYMSFSLKQLGVRECKTVSPAYVYLELQRDARSSLGKTVVFSLQNICTCTAVNNYPYGTYTWTYTPNAEEEDPASKCFLLAMTRVTSLGSLLTKWCKNNNACLDVKLCKILEEVGYEMP